MSRRAISLAALGAAIVVIVLLRIGVGPQAPAAPPPDRTPLGGAEQREIKALLRRAEEVNGRIETERPDGTYIVIDTGRNLLTLFEGGTEILMASDLGAVEQVVWVQHGVQIGVTYATGIHPDRAEALAFQGSFH